MNKEDALKKYYDTELNTSGLKPFDKLSLSEQFGLSESYGFIMWWANHELTEAYKKATEEYKKTPWFMKIWYWRKFRKAMKKPAVRDYHKKTQP